jgi:acyl dehydratase
MPITYDEVISRRIDNVPFRYEDTRVLLYNLGVGMGRDPFDKKEMPFFFERPALRAVPTVASVLGGGGNPLAGLDLNLTMILHGEQRLSLYRPFPPSADLIGSSWISEVVDKGPDKGAIITMTTEAKLATGEPVYASDNVLFARGDGGCGGPSKSKFSPHVMPERAPDLVHVTETRPDQALLYRLNGDRNPLHAEPEFAKRAGFPGPILHGLCSYGVACRAVLASVCDYDPARMKSFDVRFTSPVFPGETIHTDIWVDGDVVSFRSRIEARGVVSINNGRCLISA